MLTMTDRAALLIRDLAAQEAMPETGGVRIASDISAGELSIELAQQPNQGDEVVDQNGARVFLDSGAVQLLGDASMDATVDDEGMIQFDFTDKTD